MYVICLPDPIYKKKQKKNSFEGLNGFYFDELQPQCVSESGVGK